MSAAPVPTTPTYDALVLHALQPDNVAPLSVGDLYRAQIVVRGTGGCRQDDPFFLLADTMYPVRNVEVVGFVAGLDCQPRDRSKQGGERDVGIKMVMLLDDGDGEHIISVHQMLVPRPVEVPAPSRPVQPASLRQRKTAQRPASTRDRSASPSRPSTHASGIKISVGADGLVRETTRSGRSAREASPVCGPSSALAPLMSSAWPASKPGESSASGAKRYITRAEREACAAAQLASTSVAGGPGSAEMPTAPADPYAEYRYRGPHAALPEDAVVHGTGSAGAKGKGRARYEPTSAADENGYPSIPSGATATAYAHDRRYITRAQQQRSSAQVSITKPAVLAAPAAAPAVVVSYDWPQYAVGSIVRVRGRLKEWRRRTGQAVREIEVVPADGGGIVAATPADEHLHLAAVAAAWCDVYTRPIDAAPVTPSKRRLLDSDAADIRRSPTCSIISQASQMSICDSPARLRHPSKLRSAHVTKDRLSTYVSAYIAEVVGQSWSDPAVAGIDSDIGWRQLQRYMPELSRPVISAEKEKENVPPGCDGTPRPSKRGVLTQQAGTPRSQTRSTSSQLQPVSLASLQYVPHLRLFARRLYHIESKRKDKNKRKRDGEAGGGGTAQQATALTDAAKEKATRRRAISRLFNNIVLDLVARGWLVEVELSAQDLQRRQANSSARDRSGNSLADSTISSTAISSMNASLASFTSAATSEDSDWSSAEEQSTKTATIGYLPVLPAILGRAIVHILSREQEARAKRFIPAKDPRRTNGLDTHLIASRLKSLHVRWERLDEDVVIDGLEGLSEQGRIKRWGTGWWLASIV